MGMFDSILVNCPKCGEKELEFQSKVGDCTLEKYNLTNADPVVLVDIAMGADKYDEYYWHQCPGCGVWVRLKLVVMPQATAVWHKNDPKKKLSFTEDEP